MPDIISSQQTTEKLNALTDKAQRTDCFVEWLHGQNDDTKQLYAINWRMPHTLFNVSCRFFSQETLQNIDWYRIFKKGVGRFSHGGPVIGISLQ